MKYGNAEKQRTNLCHYGLFSVHAGMLLVEITLTHLLIMWLFSLGVIKLYEIYNVWCSGVLIENLVDAKYTLWFELVSNRLNIRDKVWVRIYKYGFWFTFQ